MKPQEKQEKISSDVIRKVTIADIPEIARINVECWKHNYKGIIAQDLLDDMSVEKTIQRWIEHFEEMQVNKAFYLKEIDGKIVGFISWGINDDPQVEYENEITWLYVDVQQQSKHIGKELFEKLLEDEKFKVCDSFYLRTLKDNPQSNRFYQKLWGKKFSYKNHQKFWTTLVWYYRQK